jgi:methyl-accepting chemotaxis protein
VKSLATQTGKATEDIAAQVAAVQEATHGGVDAIKSVGQIIAQVGKISATVASAVEEQSATTQEITRNTQEAARGTQALSVHIAGVSQGAGMTGNAADHVLNAAGEPSRTAGRRRAEVDSLPGRIRAPSPGFLTRICASPCEKSGPQAARSAAAARWLRSQSVM